MKEKDIMIAENKEKVEKCPEKNENKKKILNYSDC